MCVRSYDYNISEIALMPANKRITDLTDYISVLPYASELFGVYQPLLGWRSKRRLANLYETAIGDNRDRFIDIKRFHHGLVDIQFDPEFRPVLKSIAIGRPSKVARPSQSGVLYKEISTRLNSLLEASDDELKNLLADENLNEMLKGSVFLKYQSDFVKQMQFQNQSGPTSNLNQMQSDFVERLRDESAFAGVLSEFARQDNFKQIRSLFFDSKAVRDRADRMIAAAAAPFDDPIRTFDPTQSIKDVSLSPIGVVHLYRQFFFELDSFVGTPVGHVWLSPGSSVELIEVSTRKATVENTFETSLESLTKSERSTTDKDELSDAVKEDNRNDMKLGFSTTVKQSWGTGSATASGSLNLDKTQQTGREQVHKRTREQAEKLSTEIRSNFKSTFRTVTEMTDTTSKRYVLANKGKELINYEMRRKMRQVGVQLQDVGTYLCWETFVDDPGRQLALPNLIHIAKPADMVAVPNANEIPMPNAKISLTFSGEAVWAFTNKRHQNDYSETKFRFVPLATLDIPNIPDGYEVDYEPEQPFISVEKKVVAAADNDSWNAAGWGFLGMILPGGLRVTVGVTTGSDGLTWDKRITFQVSIGLQLKLSERKIKEINDANAGLASGKALANAENQLKFAKAHLDAISERVTLASKISKRKFENLREEERTIVYRNLIKALMTEHLYKNPKEADTASGHQTRHVLSELINAVFDIDKMLYFVAPEWWRPRRTTAALSLGVESVAEKIGGSVVTWASDSEYAKYFITEKSEPAPLGSSLGWLMQLDGDDLRNAFLNAPWVKAVIPIRPGKEEAAINWLKAVGIEGSDGLENDYAAPADELTAIRTKLGLDALHTVKLADAIRHLCITVAEKHKESMTVGRYPKEELNDDNRVSAIPINKVYEHGFYPLKGGFKAITEGNFEICSQWIEVLPTDQVVPVPVTYDPITGRQVRARD